MDDVIFCQYRETGVFQQRGFTLKQFMSQLFSNRNDSGKGRNMPVHFGGKDVKVVSIRHCILLYQKSTLIDNSTPFPPH